MSSCPKKRVVRAAAKAGTWYEADGNVLGRQLDGWLRDAELDGGSNIQARAIIAPHAGYSYSGPTAAYAYKHMRSNSCKRVFLLGPSHHVHLKTCALSRATHYDTPLGEIPLDTEVIDSFSFHENQGGTQFRWMDQDMDEAEHSLELHLPFIHKCMGGKPYTLVPIMVGSLNKDTRAHFAKLLAPYLDDHQNLFVVSSDFCHWGKRFDFTSHNADDGPIYKSIEAMDREGMGHIAQQDGTAFDKYLSTTHNTICGRSPIALLLKTISLCGKTYETKFVRYAQSSQCTSRRDSSVSYASAVTWEVADK